MAIKETSVTTRANTSIPWPNAGYQASANNLFLIRENIDYIKTISVSDDNLTLTIVTIWNSLQSCLEVKLSASNADITNSITTTMVEGITFTRTTETV